MSKKEKVVYQLDLTRREALLLMALIGPLRGDLGFEIYHELAKLPDGKRALRDSYRHANNPLREQLRGVNTDKLVFE